MSAVITTPKVSARDRLAFTLFLSLALNFVVIVGISFDLTDIMKEEDDAPPSLDIILVEQNDSEAADVADFLAQVSQSGAGNSTIKSRPSTLQSATAMPLPVEGDSALLQPEQTASKIIPTQDEVLTRFDAKQKIFVRNDPEQNPAEKTTSAELMRTGQEIARINAKIRESVEVYSQRPKRHYISASTRSFRDAAYVDSWLRKIERIGNLNYPEEAKRRQLSGTLKLQVGIHADGSIESMTIQQSSGKKLLDDAAMRIVRQAAPFAALPAEMRKEVDILYISRVWDFQSGNRLITK